MRSHTLWMLALALTLGACTSNAGKSTNPADSGAGGDTGSGSGTGTDDTRYPSGFPGGKYRLTDFVLQPVDVGEDLDGDGTQDNNLPKLLTFADTAMSGYNLSPDDINLQIATEIASFDLNVLFDAVYADRALTLTVYSGIYDPDTTSYTIDSASYDDAGNPTSAFMGSFSDETTFDAGADSADVPVSFYADQPPLLVPLRLADINGSLDASGTSGLLVGAIPSKLMVDQVIAPLIPDEGVDQDGDGTIDQTKDEVLTQVQTLVDLPAMSDITFEDGTTGVSAAFTFTAIPQAF